MGAPPPAVETLDSPFQSEKVLYQEIDGELRRLGRGASRRDAFVSRPLASRHGEIAGSVFRCKSAAMSPSRKHHFIPAFYLKRWVNNEGLLIEWSRPHKQIVPIRRHPNATAFQVDLYTFEGLPEDSKRWFEEAFLKNTDDLASEAITRILAGRMETLDSVLRSGWVRFLMTLRFRHPDMLAEMRQIIAYLWSNHDAFTRAEYEKTRSSVDPRTFDEYLARLSPDAHLRVQLDLLRAGMDNEEIGNHINKMSWAVFDVSRSSYRLLTSDWPVELSLGARPPFVSIPLSPTHLFMACDDPDVLSRFDTNIADAVVATINAYVVSRARRYVFSPDERQVAFIRNRMFTDMVKTPFFSKVYETMAARISSFEKANQARSETYET
jgi:hypothetical protein